MTIGDVRERAEGLADEGSLDEALALVRAERKGRTREESVLLQIDEGALLARSGALLDAADVLLRAEAAAMGLPRTQGEARITRASVLGALGQYEEALPLLRRALRELDGLDPELEEAGRAELRAFENLTGPKNQATWAALASKRR